MGAESETNSRPRLPGVKPRTRPPLIAGYNDPLDNKTRQRIREIASKPVTARTFDPALQARLLKAQERNLKLSAAVAAGLSS